MSVILNEAGLRFFLESEGGPVGGDLQRRAENVTALATQNAEGQIIGIETGDLHSGIRFEIGHDTEGLFAIVKTDARHRGFAYPAWWDRFGGRPWLTSALRDGFDS
jgi:hypothetical protein